jgi:hypothetical protein
MPTRAVDLKSAAMQDLDISAAFNELMNGIGLSSQDTGGKITFIGADPIFESRFRIGTCISIPMMAAAAGAAIVWRMRTGHGQDLSIDLLPNRPASASGWLVMAKPA